jgi:phenylpropionate dioxygenase-like ring-hydroxylating dioxygenase large terminal subunit
VRTERQVELVNRFAAMREAKTTPMAPEVRRQPTSIYTDPDHLREERDRLFRGRYLLAGLSGEAARPGDYFTIEITGLPVVVIRGEDGIVRAMVNSCRHRGARVFGEDHGHVKGRGVACPFHSWAYDIYGKLLGQPLSNNGFEGCEPGLALPNLHVVETDGMIFVAPVNEGEEAPPERSPDEILGEARRDLSDYGLADYQMVASVTRTLPLNWKLVIDTFLEAYHIFSLHSESIASYYLSTPNPHEAMGPVALLAGIRSSIIQELEKPEQERRILPHATVGYFIYPNTIVSHQEDHIESWQVFPRSTTESVATTKVYGDGEITEKFERYLKKNLEILVGVTDNEDFPQGAQVQAAAEAGAMDHFLFGRNEPGLIHYHEWLDAAMAEEPAGVH